MYICLRCDTISKYFSCYRFVRYIRLYVFNLRVCIDQKRAEISAKSVELRLSKFAHVYQLSDEAACALPVLLRSIFPEDGIVKHISEDRILSMLLVRRVSSLQFFRLILMTIS